MKELEIWAAAVIRPSGDWYLESGSGMAQTLRVASEKRAITLTDRGTFLAQREHLSLEILVQRDPRLLNPYAVIVVNRKKHPHVNANAAQRFADFLTAPSTQRRIAEFGLDDFGMPLFFPSSQD